MIALVVAGCAAKAPPLTYRAICPCGATGEWTIVEIPVRDRAMLAYIHWQHLAALRTEQHVGQLSAEMGMAVEGASRVTMPRWRTDGLMWRVGERWPATVDSADSADLVLVRSIYIDVLRRLDRARLWRAGRRSGAMADSIVFGMTQREWDAIFDDAAKRADERTGPR